MLDRGLQTPYELQKHAGLSLGAIVPALRRLTKEKLVTRSEADGATNRPKHIYKLTTSGRQTAETGWHEYLMDVREPTDIDALLRLLDIAQAYGTNRSRLVALLRSAATQRFAMAGEVRAASKRIRAEPFSYRLTRSKVEVQRWRAEAQALKDLAKAAEHNAPQARKKHQLPPGQLSVTDLIPGQPKRLGKPFE